MPARPAPPSRGRPNKSRPKLLEAAIHEFAAKGFSGATTVAIAKRAKVPQPLIHHHFGSKDALFLEVLETLFTELHAALWPGTCTTEPDLGGRIKSFVLFTARRPELSRICVIESAQKGPHLKHILDRFRALSDLVSPLLESAMADCKLVRVDPQLLLFAMQGLASFPFLVPQHVKRASGLDAASPEFAEAYAQVVLTLLSAKSPAQ